MSQEFFKATTYERQHLVTKMKRRAMMDCFAFCASVGLLVTGAFLLSEHAHDVSGHGYIGGAMATALGALCFLGSCFDFCLHGPQTFVMFNDERATLNP